MSCDTAALQGLRDAVARLEAELRRLESGSGELPPIHRIVLTGGPCGGKSTVIGDLKQMLEDRNFLVSVMPEVATQAFEWSGGRLWADHAVSDRLSVEKSTMFIELQICIEDAIMRMAKTSLSVRNSSSFSRPKGLVILYDRGCADYRAYCSHMQWSEVMDSLGTTMTRLRDRRYDVVVHLVTAANGAEKFYTLDQAEGDVGARHESPADARELDVQIQSAWRGFANHAIVDNSGDFAFKRQRVKDLVLQAVGEKRDVANLRRLLCRLRDSRGSANSSNQIGLDIRERAGQENCKQIGVTMVYLSEFVRLQKRAILGEENPTYYHQTVDKDGKVQTQYQINTWTYMEKHKGAQESGVILHEFHDELVVYTQDNENIRYHIFIDDLARKREGGHAGEPIILAEIDGSQSNGNEAALPPWLELVQDVTSGHRYSTFPLA